MKEDRLKAFEMHVTKEWGPKMWSGLTFDIPAP
jgi:hypothetical protein